MSGSIFCGSADGLHGKTRTSEAFGNSAASGMACADDKANVVSHGLTLFSVNDRS